MILPVFAIYGSTLEGYTPLWLGLAIGAYGLTQALLQIPMGWLSDKIGRKPVIIGGLVMFALGSVVAAMSESVYGVVIGRALQGMGAIASAILALAADVSRDEQRPKVMATIGMFIGLSFILAMIIGPLVAASFGLAGLFWLTAILASLSILVVRFVVPNAINKGPKGDSIADSSKLGDIVKNPQLLRLDVGILFLHLVMTAMFVSLPQLLVAAGLAPQAHWQMYLPTLVGAFLLMVPLMLIAIKKQQEKAMFIASISMLLVATFALWLTSASLAVIVALIVLFFIGFNYLEATMPSMLAKLAPAGAKGTAMGVYSTSQFLGAFLGGLLGGLVQSHFNSKAVFLACALVLVVWLFIALGMKAVKKVKTVTLSTQFTDEAQADAVAAKLTQLKGVVEATLIFDEAVVYLKVDEKKIDYQELDAVLGRC